MRSSVAFLLLAAFAFISRESECTSLSDDDTKKLALQLIQSVCDLANQASKNKQLEPSIRAGATQVVEHLVEIVFKNEEADAQACLKGLNLVSSKTGGLGNIFKNLFSTSDPNTSGAQLGGLKLGTRSGNSGDELIKLLFLSSLLGNGGLGGLGGGIGLGGMGLGGMGLGGMGLGGMLGIGGMFGGGLGMLGGMGVCWVCADPINCMCVPVQAGMSYGMPTFNTMYECQMTCSPMLGGMGGMGMLPYMGKKK